MNNTTKAQHTPGPWEIRREPDLLKIGHFSVEHGLFAVVAAVHKMPREAVNISEANARLIASAPELLKALEDLASLAEEAMREVGEYNIEVELADARAAIAKATWSAS